MDPTRIRARYIKSWALFMDVLAALPVFLILFERMIQGQTHLLALLTLLKLNRLLRIGRLVKRMDQW